MKILIVRLSSLGDVILTQPVVLRLHQAFPEAELYYVTKPAYRNLPELFGVPLNVIVYEKSIAWHTQLSSYHFDIVIDLHDKLSSHLITLFAMAQHSYVYAKQRALRRQIVRHKTNRSISSTLDLYATALHKMAQRYHKDILSQPLPAPQLDVGALSPKDQVDITTYSSLPLIALFPGAAHNTKMYPAERYANVIKTSAGRYHFLLLGSDMEKSVCAKIAALAEGNCTDLSGRFSILQLVDIISQCAAVVSNDSGPMHIAAALHKPQVAIFGATHPRLGFAPNNDKAIVITHSVSCSPCSLHGSSTCPRKHLACLISIKPEEIISALKSALSR